MNKQDIEKYLDTNDSIYVQNISGQVVSHTFTGAGKVMPYTFSKGIVPMCLTDIVPKALIINDDAFKQLIIRKRLRLISKEQYMTMKGQPVESVSKPVVIEETEPSDIKEDVIELPPDERVAIADTDQRPDMVNKLVIELVSACNDGDITVSDANDKLKGLVGLTIDDLEYVIEQCQLKGVVKNAEKLLKKVGE